MPTGQEPYRKLGIRVNTDPMISPRQCKLVLETQDVFWKYYIEVLPCLLARRPIASEQPRSQSCLGVATRCSDVCT